MPSIARAFAFLFSLLAGFSLGTILFPHLPVIPVLSNPHEIVSPLTRLSYHPANNVLRVVVLLLMAPLLWWGLARWFRRLAEPGEEAVDEQAPRWVWPAAICLASAYGALHFAQFFGGVSAHLLDGFWFFHEPETFAPAWTFWETGRLWTGSFFAHGGFYDAIAAVVSWKFFGVVSVGAARAGAQFLEALIHPANSGMIAALAWLTFLRDRRRPFAAALAVLALLSVYLLTRHEWQYWERRDLPVLVGFPIFLYGISVRRWRWLVLTGLLGALAFFYSIDRGAYFSAAQVGIVVLVALLARDARLAGKGLAAILAGFALGLLGIGAAFGFGELAAGIRSTSFLFAIKDLSDGSVYPTPAFPITNWKFLSHYHTFPLVCLAVQILAAFIHFHRRGWRLQGGTAEIVQLGLLVISCLYYRSALSRCDDLHYRYVSSFAFLGATLVLVRGLTDSPLWRRASVRWLVLALAAVPLLRFTAGLVPPVPGYFQGTSARFAELAQRPDEAFLAPRELAVREVLREEFREEACFFSLTSEPLWPFLLRKPSCGKFYLTWLISDRRLQEEAIAELRATMPGKILYGTPLAGDEMDGIPIAERARYLHAFVLEHYEPHREFEGWEIWRRKR